MADPYCTVAEADVYLALDFTNWITLTDPQKDDALFWGRVYIDSVYTCVDDDGSAYDDTTAPDALKRANALAANAYSRGELYSKEDKVTETKVKAGSVESTKKFAVPSSAQITAPEVGQIKGLLKSICECHIGSVSLKRV